MLLGFMHSTIFLLFYKQDLFSFLGCRVFQTNIKSTFLFVPKKVLDRCVSIVSHGAAKCTALNLLFLHPGQLVTFA